MKIRIDKARKKAGQKSYALDARSLGLGQMYFDTFEQAEHEQQKILQDHNTILAESFSWNFAKLVGKFSKDPNKLLPGSYFKYEYDRMKKGAILPGYFYDQEETIKVLLECKVDNKLLSKMLVRNLSTGHCQFQILEQLENNGRRGKRSIKTLRNMRTVFNKLMDFAIACGCRSDNPFKAMKLDNIRGDDLESQLKKINPYDINTIGEQIKKTYDRQTYLAFQFSIMTGVRAGELAALTWDKISFDTNEVTINRSYKKEVGVANVKTLTGNRIIPLKVDLVQQLKEFYIKLGRPDLKSLVFGQKCGNPYHNTYFKDRLQRAAKAVGINAIKWHDLRHYYASVMLDYFGDDIWTVSNLMGHNDISTTTKVYGHWIQDAKKKEKLANDLRNITF